MRYSWAALAALGALLLLSSVNGLAGSDTQSEPWQATDGVDERSIVAAMEELDLSKADVKSRVNRSLVGFDNMETIREETIEAIDEGNYIRAAHTLSHVEETEVHLYCSEAGFTPKLRTWVWAIPRAMECEDQTQGDLPPERSVSRHDPQYDVYVDVMPSRLSPCEQILDWLQGNRISDITLETVFVTDPHDEGGDELTMGLGYPWQGGTNPTITMHGIDQGDRGSFGESVTLSASLGNLCRETYVSAELAIDFTEGSLSSGETVRYTHGNYGGRSTYVDLVSDGSNTDARVKINAHDRSGDNDYSSWPDWGIELEELEGNFLKAEGEIATTAGDISFRGCDLGAHGSTCSRLGDTVTPIEFDYMRISKTDGGGTGHELKLGFGSAQPTFELKGTVDGAAHSFAFTIEGFPETSYLRYDDGDDENGFASVDLTKYYDRYDGYFGWLQLSGTMDHGEKELELEGQELERFRFGFGDDDSAPHGPSSGESKKVAELTANHANHAGYAMASGTNTSSGSSYTQWLYEEDNEYRWRYSAGGIGGSGTEADGRNKTADIDPPDVWKEGIFLTFLGSTATGTEEDSSAWLGFQEIGDSGGKWPCVYHITTPWTMPGEATCA